MFPTNVNPQRILVEVPWSEVLYETDKSGRLEVVVQAFPVASGKWQVSTDEGAQSRWR